MPHRYESALAQVVAAMPERPDTTTIADDEHSAVREAAHAYFSIVERPPPDDVPQADHVVPATKLPVRVYRPPGPRGGTLPALLWIHGGGFTVGAIQADDGRCRGYVRAAGCIVVSLEHRLAPEHPYPAGVDDCWAAVAWTLDHADELGIDRSRLAIGGASAGACLAAAIALRARAARTPAFAFQMLVYPMLDDRLETQSSREKTDVPIFSRGDAAASWRRYLRDVSGEVPPDAAPARVEDVAGLPTTYLLTAEHDPLRDEGIEYATRLQAASVSTELHTYAGTFHGFESIGLDAPIARRALAEQGRALRDALHEPNIVA